MSLLQPGVILDKPKFKIADPEKDIPSENVVGLPRDPFSDLVAFIKTEKFAVPYIDENDEMMVMVGKDVGYVDLLRMIDALQTVKDKV